MPAAKILNKSTGNSLRLSVLFFIFIFAGTNQTTASDFVGVIVHIDTSEIHGIGDGQFTTPAKIHFMNNNLYVMDHPFNEDDRIQILDLDLNYIDQFGNTGNDADKMYRSNGFTGNGTHLFVANNVKSRVQVYLANGTLVSIFSNADEDGGVSGLHGIALNQTNIFLSDNSGIEIYDFQGNYQGLLLTHDYFRMKGNGTHAFLIDHRVGAYVLNLASNETTQIGDNSRPGVAVGTADHIFVLSERDEIDPLIEPGLVIDIYNNQLDLVGHRDLTTLIPRTLDMTVFGDQIIIAGQTTDFKSTIWEFKVVFVEILTNTKTETKIITTTDVREETVTITETTSELTTIHDIITNVSTEVITTDTPVHIFWQSLELIAVYMVIHKLKGK